MRYLAAYAATLVVLASCFVGLAIAAEAVAKPACHDDKPCWVWSKMGNLKRGVVLKDGTRATVTVCRFATLRESKRIDWQRTPRLRGDWHAIAACNND